MHAVHFGTQRLASDILKLAEIISKKKIMIVEHNAISFCKAILPDRRIDNDVVRRRCCGDRYSHRRAALSIDP